MPTWLPVVITIVLFVVTIYNGVIGYFLNQHMKRVDSLEAKQEATHRELQEFKQHVPTLYIRQDEYIRLQSALDHKLEKILDAVVELRIGLTREHEAVVELRQRVSQQQEALGEIRHQVSATQQRTGSGSDEPKVYSQGGVVRGE